MHCECCALYIVGQPSYRQQPATDDGGGTDAGMILDVIRVRARRGAL